MQLIFPFLFRYVYLPLFALLLLPSFPPFARRVDSTPRINRRIWRRRANDLPPLISSPCFSSPSAPLCLHNYHVPRLPPAPRRAIPRPFPPSCSPAPADPPPHRSSSPSPAPSPRPLPSSPSRRSSPGSQRSGRAQRRLSRMSRGTRSCSVEVSFEEPRLGGDWSGERCGSERCAAGLLRRALYVCTNVCCRRSWGDEESCLPQATWKRDWAAGVGFLRRRRGRKAARRPHGTDVPCCERRTALTPVQDRLQQLTSPLLPQVLDCVELPVR